MSTTHHPARRSSVDNVVYLASRGLDLRAGESVEDHYARAQRLGWRGPPDVLELLFGVNRAAAEVTRRHPGIQWTQLQWVERALSVAEVEALLIERSARGLVDEVRRRFSVGAERDPVENPGPVRPVVLAGDGLSRPGTIELVSGFTLVGQWLGAIDRLTASGVGLLERLATEPKSLLYKPLTALPPHRQLRVWVGV